jgi:hypothetical protein
LRTQGAGQGCSKIQFFPQGARVAARKSEIREPVAELEDSHQYGENAGGRRIGEFLAREAILIFFGGIGSKTDAERKNSWFDLA